MLLHGDREPGYFFARGEYPVMALFACLGAVTAAAIVVLLFAD